MFRSTVLYRRLWYVKRRNSKKLHVMSRIAAILIILASLVLYAQVSLIPNAAAYAEYKLEAEVAGAIRDAAGDGLPQGFDYENSVKITRDPSGYITSIETNTDMLDRASSQISAFIQEKLAAGGMRRISLPLSVLAGSSAYTGGGPGIYIKVHPVPEVEAHFKPEFSNCGENRTKYSLSLVVLARILLDVPFGGKECEFMTEIPVGETIILGNMQDS